jgi:hypothetical protein
MGITLTVTGLEKVRARLAKLKSALNDQSFLDVLAQDVIAMMVKRVSAGGGSDGQMKAYSPRYADWRKANGKQVGHRDLNVTGQMIQNIGIVEKTLTARRIGFSSQAEQKKAYYNELISRWFSLTTAEKAYVSSRVMEHIRDAVKR